MSRKRKSGDVRAHETDDRKRPETESTDKRYKCHFKVEWEKDSNFTGTIERSKIKEPH
jgi:hypothetical protein